jgi:hypothetical protein
MTMAKSIQRCPAILSRSTSMASAIRLDPALSDHAGR